MGLDKRTVNPHVPRIGGGALVSDTGHLWRDPPRAEEEKRKMGGGSEWCGEGCGWSSRRSLRR